MSTDFELESWRREWSVDTEPLPELRKRLYRQNRRLLLGAVAMACCLAAGSVMGLRYPDSGWGGFAVGVWAACLVAGGYALWLRRGTWEPAAQTTHAYLDLLHRRAVAELGKIVFIRRALAVVLAGFGVFELWRGRGVNVRAALVAAALVLELGWLYALERRRRRAVADAAALLELTPGHAEPRAHERTYPE